MKSYLMASNGGVLTFFFGDFFFLFFSYKSDKSYTSSILNTLLQKVMVFAIPVRLSFKHPFFVRNQALARYNGVLFAIRPTSGAWTCQHWPVDI